MIDQNSPYYFEDIESLDSPSLLVYPDLVNKNIEAALKMTQSFKETVLRPHIKTVKCREPLEMAMKKGIEAFKCSTIAEAELLGIIGAKDVLLCYQLSAAKAIRFTNLRNKFPSTHFSALIDNVISAKILSEHFIKEPLKVFIDIDVGMQRTGVKMEEVLPLVQEIQLLKGLELVGLHTYDGHVQASHIKIRQEQTETIFTEVEVLRAEISKRLKRDIELVIGGSPSFPFYAQKKNVSCSPGTFFFWDAGYENSFPEMPFVPAALLLTRIVSITDTETLCFDLGSKAVAADPPQPRVYLHNLPGHKIINQYEEHLVVSAPISSRHNVGEPFLATPTHVCPTVNLYEELVVIKNGEVKNTWAILARNRKITV